MARIQKRMTLTLDPSDCNSFERIAKESDVSVSWLVRQAMREFLEKYGHQGHPVLGLRLALTRRD